MKTKTSSLDQILTMKGFKHGAGGQPRDPAYVDCKEYQRGYWIGAKALEKFKWDLVDEFYR